MKKNKAGIGKKNREQAAQNIRTAIADAEKRLQEVQTSLFDLNKEKAELKDIIYRWQAVLHVLVKVSDIR